MNHTEKNNQSQNKLRSNIQDQSFNKTNPKWNSQLYFRSDGIILGHLRTSKASASPHEQGIGISTQARHHHLRTSKASKARHLHTSKASLHEQGIGTFARARHRHLCTSKAYLHKQGIPTRARHQHLRTSKSSASPHEQGNGISA